MELKDHTLISYTNGRGSVVYLYNENKKIGEFSRQHFLQIGKERLHIVLNLKWLRQEYSILKNNKEIAKVFDLHTEQNISSAILKFGDEKFSIERTRNDIFMNHKGKLRVYNQSGVKAELKEEKLNFLFPFLKNEGNITILKNSISEIETVFIAVLLICKDSLRPGAD